MMIFMAFIIPVFLQVSIDSLHQHAFMKVTTEYTTLVEEGGDVLGTTADLMDRGYDIKLMGEDGSTINLGNVEYGDTFVVDFDYEYKNVRGMENLSTQNRVTMKRR